MLLEAAVTTNPDRPDAVAGRAAGPPDVKGPRPDHESRDSLQGHV